MMDLTTVDRVKRILVGGDTSKMSSQQNAFLSNMIASVSALVEQWLDRFVKSEAQKEFFDVEWGQRVYKLKGFPIDAGTIVVKNSFSRDFATATAIVASNYNQAQCEVKGTLKIDKVTLSEGPGMLQVEYDGGMSDTTANFIAAFPDVSNAVDFQVAYYYQRRNQLGLSGLSQEGGNVSYQGNITLLPAVKIQLQGHKRETVF